MLRPSTTTTILTRAKHSWCHARIQSSENTLLLENQLVCLHHVVVFNGGSVQWLALQSGFDGIDTIRVWSAKQHILRCLALLKLTCASSNLLLNRLCRLLQWPAKCRCYYLA